MGTEGLVQSAKLTLRIMTNAFDEQINDLIQRAMADLGIAGVIVPDPVDAIVKGAILTYVQMKFGQPDNYGELKASYDEQKAQLSMATNYTNWEVRHGQE